MKHFLLLLTLISFCLSAAGPEAKETVDSITYQVVGWFTKENITIEKTKNPHSVAYSLRAGRLELKVLGYGLTRIQDGACIVYTKSKQTKEISKTITYDKLTTCEATLPDWTNITNKVGFKIIKALFILSKHMPLPQKTMNLKQANQ